MVKIESDLSRLVFAEQEQLAPLSERTITYNLASTTFDLPQPSLQHPSSTVRQLTTGQLLFFELINPSLPPPLKVFDMASRDVLRNFTGHKVRSAQRLVVVCVCVCVCVALNLFWHGTVCVCWNGVEYVCVCVCVCPRYIRIVCVCVGVGGGVCSTPIITR
jgi:hypothetical protein